MLVSVVVPTFNRSKLLLNCVNSLLNQSFKEEYEIIIIDNNSSDDTFDQYKNNFGNNPVVRYAKELRKGLVFSRHLGLHLADSPVLIFTDDDGEYSYNCIEAIYNVYKSNDSVVAVGGKIEIKWDKDPPDWIYKYEYLLGKLDYGTETVISKSIYINGGLYSIKKDVLIDVNGFNPDQIGDYLVGDGESGLCEKLHQKGFLIGWTPHAIMKHLQFTDKNGTLKDIGRRFYNNGIGGSYRLLSVNKFNLNMKVLFNLLVKTTLFITLLPFSFFSRRIFFKKEFVKGEINFYILWQNKEYREQVKRNNWF